MWLNNMQELSESQIFSVVRDLLQPKGRPSADISSTLMHCYK